MLGTARFKLALTPPETSRPSDLPSPRFALGHGTTDRFRMRPGDGNLTILEIASGSAPRNDVTLERPYISTTADVFDDHGDAVISWSGSQAARLTIVGALISRPGSRYGVHRIRFGDGKVWTEKASSHDWVLSNPVQRRPGFTEARVATISIPEDERTVSWGVATATP